MSDIKESGDYWYDHRHELEAGQVFRMFDGCAAKLVSRVEGDGTKWTVADWMDAWFYEGSEIEPGDLRGDPIEDKAASINAALGFA